MKKSALILAALACAFSALPAFAEGEKGSAAFQWSGLSDLAPSPTTYSLSQFSGKAVLLVVFQYSCGGCNANAPKIGKLADSLQSGKPGSRFQAVGTEIYTANYTQIQSYRNNLVSNAPNVDFPLVKVPHDTAIAATDGTGEKWKRYNSYRDTYFVINHLGVITARIEGNRASTMSTVKYDSLRAALGAAIAAVPANVLAGGNVASGFRMERAGRGYRFRMNDGFSGTIRLRVSDLQGRVVRAFSLDSSSPEAAWNGTDASGSPLPYGMYFVQAAGPGLSLRRSIPLLP